MTVPEDSRRYVTLREAAEETGASVPALRRWYRQGLIDSITVPGAHGDQRLVDIDEVTARAAASPNLGRRRSRRVDQHAVIDALVEQVAALAMEVSDLRDRLDALDSEGY